MALFHRDRRKNTPSSPKKSAKELTLISAVEPFLAEGKRGDLATKIQELMALEHERYQSLCDVLLKRLVTYCQNLPESVNSYYSQAGGLFDYSINRAEAALNLFQEFLIYDEQGLLSEEQMLWQYALYSAALLQGIGKLFVDYQVSLFDAQKQLLKEWNPLLESLGSPGQFYTHVFQKEPELSFRRRLNLLIARDLMPVSGFNWIASNAHVLATWLALLHEDQESAGTLGAILIRADAIAIQRYFLELTPRGAPFAEGRFGRAGTFSNDLPNSLLEKEQAAGLDFVHWLSQSLESGQLAINKAPLFMVPGGLLMCQEIFQLFVRENPEYKNWQAVQNGFLALNLHQPGLDGEVVSRFEQTQTKQIQSGIVFTKFGFVIPDQVNVKQMQSGNMVSMSAVELIGASAQHYFSQKPNLINSYSLQQLNAAGRWQNINLETTHPSLGAKRGV